MPVRFMSRKVAENICETIGEVTWSMGANTEDGGSFIWVMMIVDITQPLCWGRLITLENGEKSWIVFKYECLPNICYWCGCLDHDDKDCDIWIDSKGSLPLSQPQFGLVYVLPLTNLSATMSSMFQVIMRSEFLIEGRKKQGQWRHCPQHRKPRGTLIIQWLIQTWKPRIQGRHSIRIRLQFQKAPRLHKLIPHPQLRFQLQRNKSHQIWLQLIPTLPIWILISFPSWLRLIRIFRDLTPTKPRLLSPPHMTIPKQSILHLNSIYLMWQTDLKRIPPPMFHVSFKHKRRHLVAAWPPIAMMPARFSRCENMVWRCVVPRVLWLEHA